MLDFGKRVLAQLKEQVTRTHQQLPVQWPMAKEQLAKVQTHIARAQFMLEKSEIPQAQDHLALANIEFAKKTEFSPVGLVLALTDAQIQLENIKLSLTKDSTESLVHAPVIQQPVQRFGHIQPQPQSKLSLRICRTHLTLAQNYTNILANTSSTREEKKLMAEFVKFETQQLLNKICENQKNEISKDLRCAIQNQETSLQKEVNQILELIESTHERVNALELKVIRPHQGHLLKVNEIFKANQRLQIDLSNAKKDLSLAIDRLRNIEERLYLTLHEKQTNNLHSQVYVKKQPTLTLEELAPISTTILSQAHQILLQNIIRIQNENAKLPDSEFYKIDEAYRVNRSVMNMNLIQLRKTMDGKIRLSGNHYVDDIVLQMHQLLVIWVNQLDAQLTQKQPRNRQSNHLEKFLAADSLVYQSLRAENWINESTISSIEKQKQIQVNLNILPKAYKNLDAALDQIFIYGYFNSTIESQDQQKINQLRQQMRPQFLDLFDSANTNLNKLKF